MSNNSITIDTEGITDAEKSTEKFKSDHRDEHAAKLRPQFGL